MIDLGQAEGGGTLSFTSIVLAAVWLGACLCAAAVAAGEPAGWVNARDCGASGSQFETAAETTAGSKQIVVKNMGDFQVGQGVMISKCNPHYTLDTIWGPRGLVIWGKKIQGQAEIRGYNGDQGDWVVLVLDVGQGSKDVRWSEDLARTWHPDVPITGDWQPIRDGIEVKFNKFEWEKGYTVVFSARGQLVSVIEKIEGNTILLRDAPTRTAKDAVLRHCDDAALQTAIDQGIKEKRNVYVPTGHYRLSRGLRVGKPEGITIEGENAVHTVLDISEGNGACVTMAGGVDVTLRNFTMIGHSGFDRSDQCGHIPMKGSSYFWGFAAKGCNATTISSTERVLIENCHGRNMATECFVSGSRGRGTPDKPNPGHTKQTTYLRCSAIDCGRNGFNDVTCGSENTSVLYCRIVNVGGCSWEGAGRFVRFIGNYVRNSGPIAMGNLGPGNRDPSFDYVGAGQHIIADNVFEGGVSYAGRSGGNMICTSVGSTQVIVRNNLFINFNSSGVTASGRTDPTHYASSNTIISGNIFDMTCVDEKPLARYAVDVSASDAIVSNNQVYVRGAPDAKVTGVVIKEPAVNVSVHDNLIRNCGIGILTGRVASRVGEVTDKVTFAPAFASLPLDSRRARQCEGWRLVWLAGGKPAGVSVLDAVIGAAKPETVQFKLKEPREIKAGDAFETIPPSANWNIHSNTITGCLRPVVLDSYGSPTSVLRKNVISRGEAQGVAEAVVVNGTHCLIDNYISGFDEKDAAALVLRADRPASPGRLMFRDNIVEKCSHGVKTTDKRLWDEAVKNGNLFTDCEVPNE
ncbi:MAG: right-handed parallel beta-helix repeat-containing protein [Planctomycetota bacterium]